MVLLFVVLIEKSCQNFAVYVLHLVQTNWDIWCFGKNYFCKNPSGKFCLDKKTTMIESYARTALSWDIYYGVQQLYRGVWSLESENCLAGYWTSYSMHLIWIWQICVQKNTNDKKATVNSLVKKKHLMLVCNIWRIWQHSVQTLWIAWHRWQKKNFFFKFYMSASFGHSCRLQNEFDSSFFQIIMSTDSYQTPLNTR